MASNCTMMAYTEALKEDEIELSLGLSIGGTLKKSKPVEKELVRSIDINTNLTESHNIFSGSSLSPVEIVCSETDMEFDPLHSKREIHALRRQEARRKREERQTKKRKLEANREVREEEEDGVTCKREKFEKTDDNIEYGYGTETMKRSVDQINLGLDSTIYSSTQLYPVVPMQYHYSPAQYVPFAFPYVMPCWMPGAGAVDSEKNVVHPVACRSFWPVQAHGINCGLNFSNECDSEQNSDKYGRDGQPISNDSPGCGSSAISENRSISLQGDSSSESGSDSSHSKSSKPQQNNASTGSDTQGYSDHSASSHPIKSNQGIDKETNYTEKVVSSRIAKPKEETASETPPDPINKPISTTGGNPTLLKETKGEMGKPPKPQQNHDNALSLQQMPCVSTTGNGPNGKTIAGFLYRYTKTEVSIVCVCHGISFSPAEFVKHAGGIDVSHPLRHITVVSSAFG